MVGNADGHHHVGERKQEGGQQPGVVLADAYYTMEQTHHIYIGVVGADYEYSAHDERSSVAPCEVLHGGIEL